MRLMSVADWPSAQCLGGAVEAEYYVPSRSLTHATHIVLSRLLILTV
jgi:hypothetical protein